MNRWTDSGGKGVQGVEINGVIPEIPYLPLSHDVGNYIHVVNVKDRGTEITPGKATSGCEP